MKYSLRTLIALGALAGMAGCSQYETREGTIVSEDYEKKRNSYVLRVKSGDVTNTLQVLHLGSSFDYSSQISNLAATLEVGDRILFTPNNFNSKGIGHIYAHKISRVEKGSARVQE